MNVQKYLDYLKDIFLYKAIERELSGCKTVLDVGCGKNSPLRNIKKTFYSEGIDIHEVSLKESMKKKIHDKYIKEDIRKLKKHYKEKTFDSVIALDVIEHLKKNEALELIKNMENIAKNKIIILTPNGYQDQDELWGNPYQKHLSAWHISDLEQLGYDVRGLRGLKFLRDHAEIKFRPWILWGLISFISEPLLYFIPQLSYHLFAVKTKNP